MKRVRLSVIILARNEERHLAALLPTLTWADEVLVIDDDSRDGTRAVAQRLGARVVTRSLGGDYAAARNVGLDLARGEWVFYVDADERVPQKTVAEIRAIIGSSNAKDGYLIRRVDVFLGKRLRYGETGHLALVRLGKRTAGRWRRRVHEVWQITDCGETVGVIEHYSHESLRQFARVVRVYARIEAEERIDTGHEWSLWEFLIYPVGKFLYTFLWQMGWRDGWRGLLMSAMMSYHSFLVRWYRLTALMLSGHFRSWRVTVLRVGIFLVWGGVILGQLLRLPVGSFGAIYLFEPVMVLMVGWWMLGMRVGWWRQPELSALFRAFVVVMGFLGLSLLINSGWLGVRTLVAGLYWSRLWLYGLFASLMVVMTQKGWGQWLWRQLLIWVGGGVALGGLVQYVLWPDTRWLYYFGWDDHYYRLIGTWFDPGFIGLCLALTLVLLEKRLRGLSWITYGLVFAALMLTYARSAWLVYVVGIGVLALRWRSWRLVMSRWGLVALALLLIPKPEGEGGNLARTYTVTARASSSSEAVRVFVAHPLLGVGFNAYRYVVPASEHALGVPVHPSGPDNSWLLLLATGGMAAAVGVLVFVYRGWQISYMSAIGWTSFLMIGAHALTNNSLFYPFIMLWMGGLLAMVVQETR